MAFRSIWPINSLASYGELRTNKSRFSQCSMDRESGVHIDIRQKLPEE